MTPRTVRSGPFPLEIDTVFVFVPLNSPKKGKGVQTPQKAATRGVIGGNPGQVVASQAFSYNLYEVTDNLRVLCRCAIDGFVPKRVAKGKQPDPSELDFVRTFALNQYDPSRSKTSEWAKYLETRGSTVLAQEISNNNFKCARWGMKAMLSGAKCLKLGFVARANVHSTDQHLIHGVKTYETLDFVRNKLRIRSTSEPWTVFAKFMKCIDSLKDGRYIAVRDPLKQVIRMYQVEENEFKKGGMPPLSSIKGLMRGNKKNAADKKNTGVDEEVEVEPEVVAEVHIEETAVTAQ